MQLRIAVLCAALATSDASFFARTLGVRTHGDSVTRPVAREAIRHATRPATMPATHRRSGGSVQMFFDQFDRDSMRMIMDAQTQARNAGVSNVGTEHLLLAATMQQDAVQNALQRSGVSSDTVRSAMGIGGGGSMP